MIMDPCLKYLSNIISNPYEPGIQLPLENLTLKQINSYSDQFRPYQDIFGCNLFETNNNKINYNGSLFRLPLRNEPSEISDTVYNKDSEICKLFEILFRNADSLLLFTQNVNRVEFYILDDTSADMKLIFELSKSPVKFIKKHDIDLSPAVSDEFKQQSNFLKASKKALSMHRSPPPIETSFILKNTKRVDLLNWQLISKTRIELNGENTFWLVVSTFNSSFMRLGEADFKSFMPCVGMALELNQDCLLKTTLESLVFCFLPMSIRTKLNYHINGAFSLSDDRLKFYEHSDKNDKSNSNKHLWNQYLLQPLVANLQETIRTYTEHCVPVDVFELVKTFWPIENTLNLLVAFEDTFYKEICSLTTHKSYFPLVNSKMQKIEFINYTSCVFVDFYFEENAQQLALKILRSLVKVTKKHVIHLPPKFIQRIKSENRNDPNVVNDYQLLEKVIFAKQMIDIDDYDAMIQYFINEKCSCEPTANKYALLIMEQPVILSSSQSFCNVSDLVNPNSSPYYRQMIEPSDNLFPSDLLCSSEKTLFQLVSMGLLTHNLSHNIIIKLANKVSKVHSIDQVKARQISQTLVSFLREFYKGKTLENLTGKLKGIKWMYSKSKPAEWMLPWYTSGEARVYEPAELASDKYEVELGCVRPIRELDYTFMVPYSFENELVLIDHVIQQLKLLIEHFRTLNDENLNNQRGQFEKFNIKFYELLLNYSTENNKLNDTQIAARVNLIKSKLPVEWIYCPDSKECRFYAVDSFAFDIEHPCEPFMLKFPNQYSRNHWLPNFFVKMGLIEQFTINALAERLIGLKKKFMDKPLDELSIKYCQKLLQEMIRVDSHNKLKNLRSLTELIQLKQLAVCLPDEQWILRDVNSLCFEKSLGMNSVLFGDTSLYVLNSCCPPKIFGIQALKNKYFNIIGEPFGQKEELIDRIKDILQRYSKNICIFKELIQNADDARATEIKFILDTRNLKQEKTFGISFNDLQGPALCCWNNAIFEKQDLKGITSLGRGSKADEIQKCGRFGVGFNSVYHLTDAPQFISDFNEYCIFDPLCQFFPEIEVFY